VLPEAVIYDVELTLSLPPSFSATSGVNAIAHAVEALYARDANPMTSLMAETGIAALGHSLSDVVLNPADRHARQNALFGAWLCGSCLAGVGMALQHKICHVLGGAFGLSHAATHAVMLPHVTAYNTEASPDAMRRIERALGVEDAASGLFALNRSIAAPIALRDLGMPEAGIEEAVELVMQDQDWNPRPLERVGIRALLARAWAGDSPRVSPNL
jgi:alcohol dehydrogenase class IV